MIKNYTSTVSIERSISHIESKLVEHGAKDIMKRYDSQGRLESICFIIWITDRSIYFKLPAKIDVCNKILKANVKRPRSGTWENIEKQAERTAWKIVSDWVDIQMAMIDLQQAEMLEVFLPYVYDPIQEKSFYEKIKESKFLALTK